MYSRCISPEEQISDKQHGLHAIKTHFGLDPREFYSAHIHFYLLDICDEDLIGVRKHGIVSTLEDIQMSGHVSVERICDARHAANEGDILVVFEHQSRGFRVAGEGTGDEAVRNGVHVERSLSKSGEDSNRAIRHADRAFEPIDNGLDAVGLDLLGDAAVEVFADAAQHVQFGWVEKVDDHEAEAVGRLLLELVEKHGG